MIDVESVVPDPLISGQIFMSGAFSSPCSTCGKFTGGYTPRIAAVKP